MEWVFTTGTTTWTPRWSRSTSSLEANKLADVVPRRFDLVSYGGKVYGIPLGVHRYNCLFFNKKLFDDMAFSPR